MLGTPREVADFFRESKDYVKRLRKIEDCVQLERATVAKAMAEIGPALRRSVLAWTLNFADDITEK